MPNWCENELFIKGEPEEVAKCLAYIKTEKSDFDFNTVIPYPKVYADLDAQREEEYKKGNYNFVDGYNKGGYEWCCKHWGTKWNTGQDGVNVHIDFEFALISFSTAWSPPSPVVQALSKLFPKLLFTLQYREEDNEIFGTEYFINGEEQ